MKDLRILTISGWTQPADALSILAPEADHLDYAHTSSVDDVAQKLDNSDYDIVMGWSLGGIIARQLLTNHNLNAKLLVSIAAPFQFVRNEHIEEAMPPEIFEQFYQNYRDDAVRTSKRFHGLLAKQDKHQKRILSELSHHPKVHEVEAWSPWMDFLESYSARNHNYDELPSTLIIHGKEDAIIPAKQAEHLHEQLPNAALHLMDDCGHVPHHHDKERVLSIISSHIDELRL